MSEELLNHTKPAEVGDEFVIDHETYTAVVSKGSQSCSGCVGNTTTIECGQLPLCLTRNDVIFVLKQDEVKY